MIHVPSTYCFGFWWHWKQKQAIGFWSTWGVTWGVTSRLLLVDLISWWLQNNLNPLLEWMSSDFMGCSIYIWDLQFCGICNGSDILIKTELHYHFAFSYLYTPSSALHFLSVKAMLLCFFQRKHGIRDEIGTTSNWLLCD